MLYIQEKRGGYAAGLRSIPFSSNDAALKFMEGLDPSPGFSYTLTIVDGINEAGRPKFRLIVKG